MIPAQFDYLAPKTLDEAISLLGKNPDEAKILAGGHSLIPAMKLRLAMPQMLIDLGRIKDLSYIRDEVGQHIDWSDDDSLPDRVVRPSPRDLSPVARNRRADRRRAGSQQRDDRRKSRSQPGILAQTWPACDHRARGRDGGGQSQRRTHR